ncbi:hypothetical protein MAR_035217 [Mya arenaria]|uniref:Cadherin domain-containing protein n=1 Tax=Mya arenaria TaxID=6604 RepID=A0ABY7EMV7_MYAAR|nr:hypothetical protein MAR_035217 [Mya arenaria]
MTPLEVEGCLSILKRVATITQWQGIQADGSTAISNFPAGADSIAASAILLSESVTGTLFTLTATAGTGTVSYAFASDGNPSSIAATTITAAGVVSLATGSSFDFETTTSYVFKIVATSDSGATDTGTATLTLSITDATEWSQSEYDACLSATSLAAGASIGTYNSTDVKSGQTVAYTNTGGTDTAKFTIGAASGELTVASSQTLETSTKYIYTVQLTATVSGVTPGTTTVNVKLGCSSGTSQITVLLCVLLMSVLTSLYH